LPPGSRMTAGASQWGAAARGTGFERSVLQRGWEGVDEDTNTGIYDGQWRVAVVGFER
jgi:hypothetical protein